MATSLTFLGTGNFFAPGRYWNSFLIGSRILVEAPPSVLPNLRRAGVNPATVDVLFLSHFHADHTFGWPFLLLNAVTRDRRSGPLWVAGPPGVERFLEEMLHAGRLFHLVEGAKAALGGFDLHFVEFTGERQQAGGVGFRAVPVEHDPAIECYGLLIEHKGRTIGYSGDTRPCAGLTRIAAGCDLLVLECNQQHSDPPGPPVAGRPPGHMGMTDARALRSHFPDLPLVLTHLNDDVDAAGLTGVRVPEDLERIDVS